jgi:hypothetical protein
MLSHMHIKIGPHVVFFVAAEFLTNELLAVLVEPPLMVFHDVSMLEFLAATGVVADYLWL